MTQVRPAFMYRKKKRVHEEEKSMKRKSRGGGRSRSAEPMLRSVLLVLLAAAAVRCQYPTEGASTVLWNVTQASPESQPRPFPSVNLTSQSARPLDTLGSNVSTGSSLLNSLKWTTMDDELRPPHAAVITDGPAPVTILSMAPGSTNSTAASRSAPSVLRGGILGQTMTNTALPVRYHGGSVITSSPTMYLLWYGDWSGKEGGQAIIQNFLAAMGRGSAWLDMIKPYTDRQGNPPATTYGVGGSTSDYYSQGRTLNDETVLSVVVNAVNAGKVPYDANNIYWVMASQDVGDSGGFCRSFCGYHNILRRDGRDYHIGFVGDTSHCPGACQPQSPGPNGPGYIDGIISILAHEVSEALSDPRLDAWFDDAGNENADKCSWRYGGTYAAPNGARANMQLEGQNYLIQQQWVNGGGSQGGYCSSTMGSSSAPATNNSPTRGQLVTGSTPARGNARVGRRLQREK